MRRGFTLIESIIVIVLAGIISLVLAFYIRESFSAWGFFSGQKSIAMATRGAAYRIVRELKRIKNNQSIISFNSNEIEFVDIDGNVVNFSKNKANLMRNKDILLENLLDGEGSVFTYLKKDGTRALSTDQIRVIRIRLDVVDKDNKIVIESAARIRNI